MLHDSRSDLILVLFLCDRDYPDSDPGIVIIMMVCEQTRHTRSRSMNWRNTELKN